MLANGNTDTEEGISDVERRQGQPDEGQTRGRLTLTDRPRCPVTRTAVMLQSNCVTLRPELTAAT